MTQQDKDQIVRLLRLRFSQSRILELRQGITDAIEIIEAMPVTDCGERRVQALENAVEIVMEGCPESEPEQYDGMNSGDIISSAVDCYQWDLCRRIREVLADGKAVQP